ncbi:MAG: hypothetical protein ABIC95_06765 [archaeon]
MEQVIFYGLGLMFLLFFLWTVRSLVRVEDGCAGCAKGCAMKKTGDAPISMGWKD